MDEAERLNRLNRLFYETTAEQFDLLRRGSWPGWHRLLAYLPTGRLTVLDVGCGNGRFGKFLMQQRGEIDYYGLDNNAVLLDYTQESMPDARLELRDIVEQPLTSADFSQKFDLVVLFGVLHHIPERKRRRDLVQTLGKLVKPGGIFAFTCWRFFEYERFRSRLRPVDLEPHDYLLDWRRGEPTMRYCHFIDNAEHEELVAASALTEIARFRSDGETGDVNCYSVLGSGKL